MGVINYKDTHFSDTIAELIDKQIHLELTDCKKSRCNLDQSSINATTMYFINSGNNWYPSVISLDKPFRQN